MSTESDQYDYNGDEYCHVKYKACLYLPIYLYIMYRVSNTYEKELEAIMTVVVE